MAVGDIRSGTGGLSAQISIAGPNSTEIWVDLNAILGAAPDGHEMKLNPAQMQLLNTIATKTGQLDTVVTHTGNTKAAIDLLKQSVDGISAARIDLILTALANVVTASNSSATATTASSQNIGSIKTTTDGFTGPLALIKDYTIALASVNTNLVSVKSSIDSLLAATTPSGAQSLTGLTIAAANTQYSVTIPAGTKRLEFGCRADSSRNDAIADVRWSWATNEVAAAANGIPTGTGYTVLSRGFTEAQNINLTADRLLYFSSAAAGVALSIRRWS